MNGARSLLIGSEDGIARSWSEPLREAGADIATVGDGRAALQHLELIEPELIVLDLRLLGPLDGFDTCRALRARSAAVIVMAANSEGPYDEVVALAVGADHYISGGTQHEVVVARLRSLVRRARGALLVDPGGSPIEPPGARGMAANSRNGSHPTLARSERNGSRSPMPQGATQGRLPIAPAGSAAGHAAGTVECLSDGDIEVDLLAREVRVRGVEVPLTRIEFDLLVTLARHPRRVLTREQLMMSVWEDTFDGSHVLDAHLSRLRGKITRAGGDRVAHAVRGVGYRLRA